MVKIKENNKSNDSNWSSIDYRASDHSLMGLSLEKSLISQIDSLNFLRRSGFVEITEKYDTENQVLPRSLVFFREVHPNKDHSQDLSSAISLTVDREGKISTIQMVTGIQGLTLQSLGLYKSTEKLRSFLTKEFGIPTIEMRRDESNLAEAYENESVYCSMWSTSIQGRDLSKKSCKQVVDGVDFVSELKLQEAGPCVMAQVSISNSGGEKGLVAVIDLSYILEKQYQVT